MDDAMDDAPQTPGPGDALIVVDVQKDFLPGGSLAVPEGDRVVAVMNRYIELFRSLELPLVFTRDWHPVNHSSFKEYGGPWPPHCVAGTEGAQFAAGLEYSEEDQVISKADSPEKDSYSSFEGTDLKERLQYQRVRRVFVGGLATDYCVLNTVKDALHHGFETIVLTDASRAVDVNPGDGEKALEEMTSLGARRGTRETIAGA